MYWIALKMLIGDRSKYWAIIFGITFACVPDRRTERDVLRHHGAHTSQIRDIHDADIWVMNPNVRYVDDLKAISDNAFLACTRRAGSGLGREPVQGGCRKPNWPTATTRR